MPSFPVKSDHGSLPRSSSWRLSSIILLIFLFILLFYLALLFHFLSLPPSSSPFFPSFLSSLSSPSSSVDVDSIINQRDFIIKNLRGEILYRQNKTLELESDYETKLNQDIKRIHELELEIQSLQEKLQEIQIKESQQATTSQDNRIVTGVIILGMHRSGTSIVGGLMNKMGLKTGGPLIRPNFDNEKGFFERVDVVLQNDEIMRKQNTYYSYRTAHYDTLQGIKSILTESGKFFNEGRRALAFLNDQSNFPWMLKDPRLCITLRTWLPFLTSIPAILFTYRNPMDVALSMNTRETEHFPIGRGLKLWYIYNKRAIQQSQDLCRVVTSHRKMMSQPAIELKRIYTELRERCQLPVPHEVSTEDINDFIDVKLQHGKTSLLDGYCADPTTNYDLLIPPADKWKTDDINHLRLYRSCVRLYCDLDSNKAYQKGYQFDETITDE